MPKIEPLNSNYDEEKVVEAISVALSEFYTSLKYSLQGTTQSRSSAASDVYKRQTMSCSPM